MTEQLDADEVPCPRCSAKVGAVCTTPTGRKAKTVHRERRELAASGGGKATVERAPSKRDRKKPSPPATRESRAKGGRAASASRRARRAAVEELVGQLRADALVERAAKLAEDAVRFDTDRMIVKRLALDAALSAVSTLGEALEGVRRVRLDEDGRPVVIPTELVNPETGEAIRDRDGRAKIEKRIDVRGGWTTAQIRDLSVVWGVALDKLRLEEGSATSRSEIVGSGGLAHHSDAELEELVTRSRKALGELEGGTK